VIDQVIAAHDIAEVVGRYVPLKPAGRSLKALCPFHDEKTPSFTVNPDRQTFKCFGCGKGGTAITFVIEHQGLSFPEAVRALAAERGIRVPESRSQSPEVESRVEAVRKALDFAQAFFVRSLEGSEGAEPRAYLARRGYDAAAAKRFGLGYAPPGWERLAKAAAAKGIPAAVLDDAGLVQPRPDGSRYDRFRHRVTFPIADPQGRVVSFGARALAPEDTPKYLNGPETAVFKKANLLYALDRARDGIRRSGEALLMEGYTDVLMAHVHGIDRAVAGMGTAFTPRQAALLRRFAPRVVLVYDGDDAGRAAAERSVDVLLEEGLEVRVALLPEAKDVDEILLEEGREALEAVLRGSKDWFDFRLALLEKRLDLATPRGRSQAAEGLLTSVLRVKSPVERQQYFRLVGDRLGGPETEAVLRREAARLMPGTGPRRPVPGGPAAPDTDRDRAERAARDGREVTERLFLAGILALPDAREAVFRAVGAEDFASPVLRRLYNALLDMREAGEPLEPRALAVRVAADPEATAALAGLPEDPTLDERLPSLIENLERRRRDDRRKQALARFVAGEDPESCLEDFGDEGSERVG
jgi:DNA primase